MTIKYSLVKSSLHTGIPVSAPDNVYCIVYKTESGAVFSMNVYGTEDEVVSHAKRLGMEVSGQLVETIPVLSSIVKSALKRLRNTK